MRNSLRTIYLDSIGLDAGVLPEKKELREVLSKPEKNVGSHSAGRLEELRKAIGDCHRCSLGDSRTTLVFGAGDPEAELLLVGEAPGRDEDRNPEPEEIAACKPFLLRQVEIVSPKVICALGSFASRTLLDTETRISELRGKFHDFNGIPLMPTYHPSFLLRNPGAKRDVWSDMQMVMERLGLSTEGG